MPRRGSREPDGPNARQMRSRRPSLASPPPADQAAAATPQTVRGRGHGRSLRHCLSPTALVRVQARDSCSTDGRATRASTSVWLVDRCQPVWTVTAGIEGMTWRSAGHRAACRLLSRVALSGCHHHPGDPVHPSNSVLLSATHPPFCSVSRCLSGVPEVETRGAPLPLTAAAASLLPASRRVPGPVAGLHHTPPLLLPPATCGLPTPFSTSFPPRRSRSVMGEVALVLLGVVGGAWA